MRSQYLMDTIASEHQYTKRLPVPELLETQNVSSSLVNYDHFLIFTPPSSIHGEDTTNCWEYSQGAVEKLHQYLSASSTGGKTGAPMHTMLYHEDFICDNCTRDKRPHFWTRKIVVLTWSDLSSSFLSKTLYTFISRETFYPTSMMDIELQIRKMLSSSPVEKRDSSSTTSYNNQRSRSSTMSPIME